MIDDFFIAITTYKQKHKCYACKKNPISTKSCCLCAQCISKYQQQGRDYIVIDNPDGIHVFVPIPHKEP